MTITNPQFVLAVTGGGSGTIGNLLEVGGASSWFLEGLIPYSKKSLDDFLGFEPEKYTSARTARQMAMKAYKRAIELGSKPTDAVGIGSTATLSRIENERKGRQHVAHVAIQSLGITEVASFSFLESRNRIAEERILSNIIQHTIYHIQNKGFKPDIYLSDTERKSIVTQRETDVNSLSDVMFSNKRNYKIVLSPTDTKFLGAGSIIFPGSFNPIHAGHTDIVKRVFKEKKQPVFLEICLLNVDKPPIDFIDIYERLREIKMYPDPEFQEALAGVIISDTPKFYDKVWQFPTSTYIVGVDTLNRLFDEKYGSVQKLLDLIKDTHSKFLVSRRPGYEVKIHPKYDFNLFYLEHHFKFLDGDGESLSSSAIRKSRREYVRD
jgi:nicotinic acid mononucleotide adenylyltransferase/nicotinamide mononucleotide (NMN) deamidase PncC